MLVAYVGRSDSPYGHAGIFRSLDGGNTWFRSDNGIPTDDYPWSSFRSVQRSPHQNNIALVDGGSNWERAMGGEVIILGINARVRWNPNVPGEVWLYGVTQMFFKDI